MKVLITGGAGYIGSHCNKYFMEKGIETVVLDNMLFGHEEAVLGAPLIKGDIGDAALVDAIFEGRERGMCYRDGTAMPPEDKGERWKPFDAVIHFAALADVADSMLNPQKYADVNVMRMRTLLLSMVNHGIPYCIFSSSASVFGEPRHVPIDEKHPTVPINPYGETKLGGEKLLSMFAKEFEFKYCAMRYFNAAGADPDGELGESHDPEHHVLPLIFQTALGKREKFFVYGSDYNTPDGTCQRDYIHVNDLASAHYEALNYLIRDNKSDLFNLGNSEAYSVLELIKKFEEISGVTLNYEIAERRPGDPAKLIASNEKARKLLNWTPQYSDIDTIIKTAWAWEQNRKF